MTTNKSIVTISKLNPTSFNDEAYNHLRTKIADLQNIYHIIFKHTCLKKNVNSSHDYLNEIYDEINDMFRNHLSEFCIKKNGAGPCTEAMFERSKLDKLLYLLLTDRNFHKVCKVRELNGNYPVEVQIAGSYNLAPGDAGNCNLAPGDAGSHEYLLNINNILTENQIKPEEVTYVCFQKNNELICKDITKPRSCGFCDQWVNERNMLRNMFGEMLYTNEPNILFEQMTNSIPLLPAGILEQDKYHEYNTLLKLYKQQMKNKRY